MKAQMNIQSDYKMEVSCLAYKIETRFIKICGECGAEIQAGPVYAIEFLEEITPEALAGAFRLMANKLDPDYINRQIVLLRSAMKEVHGNENYK